jgi:phosphatidylserine decarboxylase
MAVMTVLLVGLASAAFWAGGSGYVWCWPVGVVLALVWLGGLAFFRDPERATPGDDDVLVAPADGKVVEVVRLEDDADIGGPATRIGIFLSIFDVHVNRSPCSGVVRDIRYRSGDFLDARNPDSGRLNEANTVVIDPDDAHLGPIVVRQIAGLVARRIVCSLKVGDRVEAGQRIGMIKFGSRTELIVPGHNKYQPSIEVGDKAYGAFTVLARRSKDVVDDGCNRVSVESSQYA